MSRVLENTTVRFISFNLLGHLTDSYLYIIKSNNSKRQAHRMHRKEEKWTFYFCGFSWFFHPKTIPGRPRVKKKLATGLSELAAIRECIEKKKNNFWFFFIRLPPFDSLDLWRPFWSLRTKILASSLPKNKVFSTHFMLYPMVPLSTR
jgi:hypothetical protein